MYAWGGNLDNIATHSAQTNSYQNQISGRNNMGIDHNMLFNADSIVASNTRL